MVITLCLFDTGFVYAIAQRNAAGNEFHQSVWRRVQKSGCFLDLGYEQG